ncbi:MAG: site-specific DNA-methyltransferase [Candidatus Cloacimonetes bacterium]|nr:site-specific DNA-methyltransferase [Candidatus Cloacimonadota bacterium]
MDGKSFNTTEDLINKLKEIAPYIFNEDKIDWEKMKSTFSDEINFSDERYVLNWAGKSDAFRAIQSQTTATLIPDKEESVNFGNTDNIFIEGENLEVLKVLQKAYYGKIKMIYIDPPYNTGNDFIYNDKFAENRDEYYKRSGEKDEEGLLTGENLYRKNTKESGHYHSNWLTMMYPRLFLARNLLRDEGVIFVSIDDNEVHNLRMIMNEIFGEENFVVELVIQSNKRGQTYKEIAKTHEYLLCFTKTDKCKLNELEKVIDDLNLIDEIGKFNIRELRNRNPKFGKFNRPNLYYPIYIDSITIDENEFCPISLYKDDKFNIEVFPLNSAGKESCWRWGKELAENNINLNTQRSNLVAKQKADGNYNIYEKYRKSTYTAKSIWIEKEVITEQGTIELGKINLSKYFDFPKPVQLLKKSILLGTNQNDIILDFFSGSSTTAHAVLDLNKEDASTGSAQVYGNRKFIMVQLPEKTDVKSEAYKAGYETIADIGKERIRRVIKKIEDEQKGNLNFGENKQDLGFKVLKLQESNFKIWRGDKFETGEELEEQLQAFVNPIKEGSTEENMLYELLLKSGIDLNCKIEEKEKYFIINDNELVIALSEINKKIVKNIIETKPLKVITLDKLFEGNDQLKTNTTLQMKDAGIEFKVV